MRHLLLPFSFIYGFILMIRRKCYEKGIIKSSSYSIPTICIGNLAVGGTGKTPHTEYIIQHFHTYNLALLSRGYKRNTRGALCTAQLSDNEKNAIILGDEPTQYLQKFPKLPLAVAEKRTEGIALLQKYFPNLDFIILDDAYQHLAVNYNCKILLTEYHNLYVDDYPFPAGNLREFPCAAKDAQIIIVTKCPQNISAQERIYITKKLAPLPTQNIFFTYINYKTLVPTSSTSSSLTLTPNTHILLITAIANYHPLLNHIRAQYSSIQLLNFPDHHQFTSKDITKIIDLFQKIKTENKVIITTEKDIPKLVCASKNIISLLPIYIAPIEVQFISEEEKFNSILSSYVRKS